MRSEVRFVDDRTRRAYRRLEQGDGAERTMFASMSAAFDTLEENAFSGVQIPKRIIPKRYTRMGIRNLWKLHLPHGWRLIYSVLSGERIVICLVIEWFDHTNYERRFGY